MSERHHDDDITITLEFPADLAARLEDLRKEFGDELLADLLLKALATIEGKLALRGDLPVSNTNKEPK